MPRSLVTVDRPKLIVVDASVAIWAVLPFVSTVAVIDRLMDWRADDVRLVAPMLWLVECTSAIRAIAHGGHITNDEGRRALEDVLALEVDLISVTSQHARSAFEWARRTGQRRAYDGFYLAVAEELQAELWSADRRLVHGARSAGAAWVHWLGETAE